MGIISFWWEHRNTRFLCHTYKTGSYTIRLLQTTNTRNIQKHTPYKAILGTFPIEDLRQAVETAKRILTQGKIDRQLASQSSSTPFMSIKDGYVNKKVPFDIQNNLEYKIDRFMTLMSKLTTQDDGQNKQFKLKIHQGKRRGQTRNVCGKCNYDQRNYQNRFRSDSRDRRISFSGRIQCGWDYRDRPRYEQTIEMTLEEEISEGMWEQIKCIEDRIIEVYIEEVIEMITMREVVVDIEKGRFQKIIEGMTEVAVVDLDQIHKLVQTEVELDAISVENMIILQKTVWHQN